MPNASHAANDQPINDALSSVRRSLAADGYELHVEVEGSNVGLLIKPGQGACADCLAPDTVIVTIASDAIQASGITDMNVHMRHDPGS
jgi:hypothetical protein